MKSQKDKSNNKKGNSIWLELFFEYIIVFSILAVNITDGLPFTLKKSHFISGKLIEYDQDMLVIEDNDQEKLKTISEYLPEDVRYNFPCSLCFLWLKNYLNCFRLIRC